jgi:hypothetical protein
MKMREAKKRGINEGKRKKQEKEKKGKRWRSRQKADVTPKM